MFLRLWVRAPRTRMYSAPFAASFSDSVFESCSGVRSRTTLGTTVGLEGVKESGNELNLLIYRRFSSFPNPIYSPSVVSSEQKAVSSYPAGRARQRFFRSPLTTHRSLAAA